MNLNELTKAASEDFKKLNGDALGLDSDRLPAEKVSKYGNRRTEANGRTFQSGREAVRAQELQLMEKAGEIFNLGFQVRFPVGPKITYVADFVYLDKQLNAHVEDAKGVKTDPYKIKKKLFENRYPIKIEEV